MNRTWNLLFCLFIALSVCGQKHEVLLTVDAKIKHLSINKDGRLHVLTDKNICVYEGKQIVEECIDVDFKIEQIIPIHDGLYFLVHGDKLSTVEDGIIKVDSLPDIITSVFTHDDELYIGTAGSGVFKKELHSGIADHIGFENEFINDLIFLNNTLVVALDDGLACLDIKTGEILRTEDKTSIHLLAAMNDNSIIAINESGHFYKMSGSLETIKYKKISHQSIANITSTDNSIFYCSNKQWFQIDKNLNSEYLFEGEFEAMQAHGNSLILAENNTIYIYDITVKSHYSDKRVYSIFAEKDSIVWEGGLNEIRKKISGYTSLEIPVPTSLGNVYVSAIVADQTYIYAGTMGDGLFIFDRKGNLMRHVHYGQENNKNNIIQLKIKDNQLWVGYLNGLAVMNTKTFYFEKDYDNLLAKNYLYCFVPVSKNELYVGTSNQGVLHYKNGNTFSYIDSTAVYSLELSHEGLIASTDKNGVFLIENKKSTRFMSPSMGYQSILSVDSGLIFSSQNKISYFDNGQVYPISTGNLKNVLLNAICRDDSDVYIGFENGYLKVSIPHLKQLKKIGVHLNDPTLFDVRIPMAQNEFNHNENTLGFTFHSTGYYNISSNIYKYRLLGLDTTWQVTQQNKASFYNLNDGDYIFEVANGFSADFVPDSKRTFSFHINKPFWKQYWFIALNIVLGILFIIWFIRVRERRLLLKQHRKQENIKFELERLKNQIDPHFLFNSFNSLIGQIEENPENAVGTLQELSDFFRNMLKYEKVDLINLNEELKLARQYFKIHKIRFEELIELNVEVLNNNTGKVIPLSIQFLIENVIKHNVINQANPISINISAEANYLVVQNTLNKKKPGTVVSSGTGLENLKSRYQYFTKNPILIESDENFFIVKIPIIHD